MPTYEYECGACGHKFEEFQSIKAKPIAVCPKCKKRKVKRLISGGAGFIFKGSGFYETDYRSEAYKAAAKSEAGGAAGKTNSATAKTESGGKSEAAPAKTETAAKAGTAAKSESAPASRSGEKWQAGENGEMTAVRRGNGGDTAAYMGREGVR